MDSVASRAGFDWIPEAEIQKDEGVGQLLWLGLAELGQC